ncbi:peptidase S8/S53 domain-containing protein [Syncephalis fuscata]|nr:peptidase S8/S53 domain-containing protein [Syncephalis fuscata]
MIAKQAQQLATATLLLFCLTQYFGVDSAKTHKNDFHTKPHSHHPYINSKITGKPFYVTPYYALTGVKVFHAKGFKGKGVKLGIIDSGINLHADAFKGNYNYTRKLVSMSYKQVERPSECNNRGIGLAGIAVAKSRYFTGVAPEATLGTYRVFSCTGPTSSSIVLKALKTAVYNDEMKIIVLPEIAIVDERSIELSKTIEYAAKRGVIMIVAATVNNFVNQKYFSYQGLPVLRVGGAKQKYRLSHWFEEKTTGRRIEFTSSCSNMKYNFNKEVDIIPKKIKGKLSEHPTGLKRGDIALVWYDKSKMSYLLNRKMADPYFSDISAAVAYVAGAAALIVGFNQDSSIDVNSMKTILQNNAIPVKDDNSNGYVSVEYQGAGMIKLTKLIEAKNIHVEPLAIDMGENTSGYIVDVPIKISSLSGTALSYKISHIPTAGVRKSAFKSYISKSPVTAAVSFPGSINLQPKQKGEIMIQISAPTNILQNETWSYSGCIVLDPNPRFDKPPSTVLFLFHTMEQLEVKQLRYK